MCLVQGHNAVKKQEMSNITNVYVKKMFECKIINIFSSINLMALKSSFENTQHMFVCFVALCPKSTAMVMVGWSVHQPTFSWPSLKLAVNQ